MQACVAMEPLSRRHLRFLVIDELVGSVIVNFGLNGALAWLAFRKADAVPVWGITSVAADTLGTAFILPVATAVITHVLVRIQVDRALLPRLPATSLRTTRFSERNVLQRGALLGLAAMGMAAAPVITVVSLLGPTTMTPPGFIAFKATFAAVLGAFVTPVLAWWSLQDASRGT